MLSGTVRFFRPPIPLTESPERCNPDCMTGDDRIPFLIMQIIDELRAHGVLITHRGGEWRVNFRDGKGATAYVTDDLQDAFDRGRTMVLAGPVASGEAAGHLQKWRWSRSAKAQRRRMIRQHNRRMRARAVRNAQEDG